MHRKCSTLESNCSAGSSISCRNRSVQLAHSVPLILGAAWLQNFHQLQLQWQKAAQPPQKAFSCTTPAFHVLSSSFCSAVLGEDKQLTLVLFLSAFSSAISSSLSSSCSLHTFSSFVSAANSWNKPQIKHVSYRDTEGIPMNTWHDFFKYSFHPSQSHAKQTLQTVTQSAAKIRDGFDQSYGEPVCLSRPLSELRFPWEARGKNFLVLRCYGLKKLLSWFDLNDCWGKHSTQQSKTQKPAQHSKHQVGIQGHNA